MIEVFYIGQGDVLPYYYAQVRNKDGPVSLSDVMAVTFRMANISTLSVVVSDVAYITDTLLGMVEYRWAVADTSTTGDYAISFEFTKAAGSFSLPRSEMAKVVVENEFVTG